MANWGPAYPCVSAAKAGARARLWILQTPNRLGRPRRPRQRPLGTRRHGACAWSGQARLCPRCSARAVGSRRPCRPGIPKMRTPARPPAGWLSSSNRGKERPKSKTTGRIAWSGSRSAQPVGVGRDEDEHRQYEEEIGDFEEEFEAPRDARYVLSYDLAYEVNGVLNSDLDCSQLWKRESSCRAMSTRV